MTDEERKKADQLIWRIFPRQTQTASDLRVICLYFYAQGHAAACEAKETRRRQDVATAADAYRAGVAAERARSAKLKAALEEIRRDIKFDRLEDVIIQICEKAIAEYEAGHD